MTSQVINRFAFVALQEYGGFDEALSRTSEIEIPDSPADHGITGWAGVITGVLYQAKNEAEAGNLEAIEWLKSDDCYDYCMAINYNHNLVLAWLTRMGYTDIEGDENMVSQKDTTKLKRKVANKKGLPGIAVDWLRGETEIELEADAEKLIRFLGVNEPLINPSPSNQSARNL